MIDQGKKVFIGGVADSTGYGWAIAKACAEAGADIILGTWPPVLPMFTMGLERGQFEEEIKLNDGTAMKISKVSVSLIIYHSLNDCIAVLNINIIHIHTSW